MENVPWSVRANTFFIILWEEFIHFIILPSHPPPIICALSESVFFFHVIKHVGITSVIPGLYSGHKVPKSHDIGMSVSKKTPKIVWCHKAFYFFTYGNVYNSGIARNFPGGGGLHVDTTLENANFFIASPRPPYSYTTAYNINE